MSIARSLYQRVQKLFLKKLPVPVVRQKDHSQESKQRSSVINQNQESNPYKGKPNHQFWRRAVSNTPWLLVDPIIDTPLHISQYDKIASAGSCFAQHIAYALQSRKYNYWIVETPKRPDAAVFSAQYGNIYTARQLMQLFERAYGTFSPPPDSISTWERAEDGLLVDAFRPTTAAAYKTAEKVLADRDEHLKHVRHLFENMDIFIFTFGLTECWRDKNSGAVFPIAPGVITHKYPKDQFEFHNFSVNEVINDFNLFLEKLRCVNPFVKIITTVSPVPLAATYENKHILVANCYSKSVLRAAAGEICRENKDVFYFPSYEIFTGPHTMGRLYASDLRKATPHGIQLAMSIFMKHFTVVDSEIRKPLFDGLSSDTEIICDEDMLEF